MKSFIDKSVKELFELADSKKQEYTQAHPYPHIVFDDFFNRDSLKEILNEFPSLEKMNAIKYNNKNEVKLASKGEYNFGEKTKAFMHFLNSQTFLEFLAILTGIDNLMPDPYFEGGGYHQILPGGFLKIHADFNKHSKTKLDRRLNVLVYLNEDWHDSYGGNFELWDKDMKGCEKKILPLFNRMVVFSTTDFSYHGHPDALSCPQDRSRKSLALYYYTNGRPQDEINEGLEEHSTLFKARPGTGKDIEDAHSEVNSLKSIVKLVTPPIIISIAKKLFR